VAADTDDFLSIEVKIFDWKTKLLATYSTVEGTVTREVPTTDGYISFIVPSDTNFDSRLGKYFYQVTTWEYDGDYPGGLRIRKFVGYCYGLKYAKESLNEIYVTGWNLFCPNGNTLTTDGYHVTSWIDVAGSFIYSNETIELTTDDTLLIEAFAIINPATDSTIYLEMVGDVIECGSYAVDTAQTEITNGIIRLEHKVDAGYIYNIGIAAYYGTIVDMEIYFATIKKL
jgi:hypothetical protein